jgi:hypothetical protein
MSALICVIISIEDHLLTLSPYIRNEYYLHDKFILVAFGCEFDAACVLVTASFCHEEEEIDDRILT